MYAFRGKKLHLAFYYESIYGKIKKYPVSILEVSLCFPE